MSVITLTTDFGLADPFVGQMKGVILSLAPTATIVDLTHEVPPGDVSGAAFRLESVLGVFPHGTIHLAVVDPGVGSARRPIAIETENYRWVGPDNGIFTAVPRREAPGVAVVLSNAAFHRSRISATFHGRDLFAPVAAHLSAGVRLDELGAPISDLVEIDLPAPQRKGDRMVLHVVCIDRFGNLLTDLSEERLTDWLGDHPSDRIEIHVGAAKILGLRRTFAAVPVARPVAYIGGTGALEIAVRDGNAAATLSVTRGDVVTLLHR